MAFLGKPPYRRVPTAWGQHEHQGPALPIGIAVFCGVFPNYSLSFQDITQWSPSAPGLSQYVAFHSDLNLSGKQKEGALLSNHSRECRSCISLLAGALLDWARKPLCLDAPGAPALHMREEHGSARGLGVWRWPGGAGAIFTGQDNPQGAWPLPRFCDYTLLSSLIILKNVSLTHNK